MLLLLEELGFADGCLWPVAILQGPDPTGLPGSDERDRMAPACETG